MAFALGRKKVRKKVRLSTWKQTVDGKVFVLERKWPILSVGERKQP